MVIRPRRECNSRSDRSKGVEVSDGAASRRAKQRPYCLDGNLRARLMAGMASGQSLVARPRSASACSLSQRIWMKRSKSFPFGRRSMQPLIKTLNSGEDVSNAQSFKNCEILVMETELSASSFRRGHKS